MTKKLTSLFLAVMLVLSCITIMPVGVSAADVSLAPAVDTYISSRGDADTSFGTGNERIYINTPQNGNVADGTIKDIVRYAFFSFDLASVKENLPGEIIKSAIFKFNYSSWDSNILEIYKVNESISNDMTWNTNPFIDEFTVDNGFIPSDANLKITATLAATESGGTYATWKSGEIDLTELVAEEDDVLTVMIRVQHKSGWDQRIAIRPSEYSVESERPKLDIKTEKTIIESPIKTITDGIVGSDKQVALSSSDGETIDVKIPGAYDDATQWGGLQSEGAYVLFKFDLSMVDSTNSIENLEFKFTTAGGASTRAKNLYMVPDLSDDWTADTLTKADYDAIVTACSNPANIAATVGAGVASDKRDGNVADLTNAAKRAKRLGKTNLNIVFPDVAGTEANGLLIYSSNSWSREWDGTPKVTLTYDSTPGSAADSTNDLIIHPIKLTSDLSPIYDNCAEISTYTTGSVTAVTKIENDTSDSIQATIIIAEYDADGSLVALDAAPAEYAHFYKTTQLSRTIEISTAEGGRIKAFLWNNTTDMNPLISSEEILQSK